jgi:hypothetical protein
MLVASRRMRAKQRQQGPHRRIPILKPEENLPKKA